MLDSMKMEHIVKALLAILGGQTGKFHVSEDVSFQTESLNMPLVDFVDNYFTQVVDSITRKRGAYKAMPSEDVSMRYSGISATYCLDGMCARLIRQYTPDTGVTCCKVDVWCDR